jgi:hypothetical protein
LWINGVYYPNPSVNIASPASRGEDRDYAAVAAQNAATKAALTKKKAATDPLAKYLAEQQKLIDQAMGLVPADKTAKAASSATGAAAPDKATLAAQAKASADAGAASVQQALLQSNLAVATEVSKVASASIGAALASLENQRNQIVASGGSTKDIDAAITKQRAQDALGTTAAADQAKAQLQQLQAQLDLFNATTGLTAAEDNMAVVQAQVAAAHAKLIQAQEGHIKGTNAVAIAQAAYQKSLTSLTLAQDKTTIAQLKIAEVQQTTAMNAATTPGPQANIDVYAGATAAAQAGAADGVAAATAQTSAIAGAAAKAAVTAIGVGSTSTGAVPGGIGAAAPVSAANQPPTWNVSIYLDGKVVAGAVSRLLWKEIRGIAGPVTSGNRTL